VGRQAEWFANLTGIDTTIPVTQSIVNYMVHHSNGSAFERAGIPMVEGESSRQKILVVSDQ
jgi:hypothetical protein